MGETAGRGETGSWRNRQEPVLEPSQVGLLLWDKTVDEIVRWQKVRTRQFYLPLIDHQLQWLTCFLKIWLTPGGAVLTMKGVGGFLDGMITLRLVPSALETGNSSLFLVLYSC